MALKKSRLINSKTYFPSSSSKRIRTRAQTQAASSLWRLPRELRDVIYDFAFDGPLTPLEPIHFRFGAHPSDSAGLGATCKRMHAEVTQHIIENVEVQIYANRLSDERSKRLLATCQRLTIKYDPHQHGEENKNWQQQLAAAISNRQDIRTFHLKGVGEEIMGYLNRPVRADPFGVFAIVDLLAFERIMAMLSTFPKVKAMEFVKVTWSGDDKLPAEEEYAGKYRRMVMRIEQGMGGRKTGMTRPARFSFNVLIV